jgi:uncharacterized membrane protein YgcG
MEDRFGFFLFVAVMAILVVAVPIGSAIAGRRRQRQALADKERDETLFRSMFPELQPYYHPERLVEFVTARIARKGTQKAWGWDNPPGFSGVRTEFSQADKGERVRLLDTGRKPRGEFLYEPIAGGGVLRVGKGKLTVDISKPAQPRVRYWHPEREFKWSLAGWVFKTPVADEPFESSSSSSSFSSSSSDSSRSAATAAGFAGLGGTFDGGGASAGWDDAKGSQSSASPGDSAGSASAESSGGTGSTSY